MKQRVTRFHDGSIAAVLAAFALAAAPGGAQNLAPNPEFDFDTAPWSTTGAGSSLVWLQDDHSGCGPGVSGSAQGQNSAAGAGAETGYGVCVTGLTGGISHSFGVDLRFFGKQPRTGSAHMVVVWLSSPDCSGLSANFDVTDTLQSFFPDAWIRISNDDAVSPIGTQSAGLVVRLTKNEAGGTLLVDFDGAYLAPVPGFLFADGVERASTCHWHETVPFAGDALPDHLEGEAIRWRRVLSVD